MFRKPHDGFDALYAAHAERLYGFLAYRCGDPVLAEDLLADATERAFRSRASYDPRRGSAWLYTIGLNVLRDHARRQASETRAGGRGSRGGRGGGRRGPPPQEAARSKGSRSATR